MKRAFKDIPLDNITIRRFESSYNDNLKELCRKFLISIGLLQIGESRDIINELFYQFILAAKDKVYLPIDKIIIVFEKKEGGTGSNIRRHLRRLKDLNIIEKTPNGYRIVEFKPLNIIFKENIVEQLITPTIKRINEYAEKIDNI